MEARPTTGGFNILKSHKIIIFKSNLSVFQSLEYFLYAGLMMIGIMIFAGLADAFQRRQDSLLESEGGQ